VSLLSRRSRIAITTVLDIAIHARPFPVSAKAVAERLQLGPRHLENVLQALTRAGIVRGVRGSQGGYELARDRRRITLGDIVRAAQHNDVADREERTPVPMPDAVADALRDAEQAFVSALDKVALDRLVAFARDKGDVTTAGDFTI
jgi:Rrf2 family iron-sulfur cluster assembly transcriptional regulator